MKVNEKYYHIIILKILYIARTKPQEQYWYNIASKPQNAHTILLILI